MSKAVRKGKKVWDGPKERHEKAKWKKTGRKKLTNIYIVRERKGREEGRTREREKNKFRKTGRKTMARNKKNKQTTKVKEERERD